MNDLFLVLLTTAMTLGFVHTALGVDHSLPFIALARARHWSLQRTIAITVGCGTLHVLSSVLIAGVGLAVGSAGQKLLVIEETRANFAAWLLVGLGFAYAAVAFWRSRAPRLEGGEPGADLAGLSSGRLMPALFIIFALGPCEALLPLLTASGIGLDLGQSTAIAVVFSLTTVLTMVGLVVLGYLGAQRLSRVMGSGLLASWTPRLRHHAHTLAGVTLLASGLGIRLLGL